MRTAAKRKRQRETEPPTIVVPTASEPNDAELAAVADQSEELKANGAPKPNGAAKAKGAKKLSLWDYLDREERNSDGCKTKVYRLEPVIHKSGTPHYVTQRTGRFSEQDLLEECGSGRYDIWTKDSSDTLVLRDQVSIYNLNFPPRVNLLELVAGDPQNEIYLKAWAPQSKSDKTNKDGATAGDLNAILSTVLERSGSFDPKLAALWQQTAQQRDELSKLIAERNAPPDLVEQLRQLKEILPAPTPTPQTDLLAVLTQVKQLQGDPFSALEKLKAFLPDRRQEPTNSGLEQLKSVMEIMSQAKEVFATAAPPVAAATAGPDDSAWERILVNLANQAGPLAVAIPAIIAAFKGTPPPVLPHLPQPAPGTAGPALTAFDPYRNQAAMRAYAEAQRAAANATPPPPNPTAAASPQPAPEQPAADAMMAQVAGLIVQALSAMNRGLDGHRIAESFIDLNGELAFDAIASQVKTAGAPVIVAMAKNIAELREQVTAFEKPLINFIAEFAEGPEWPEQEEENEERTEEPKEQKAGAARRE